VTVERVLDVLARTAREIRTGLSGRRGRTDGTDGVAENPSGERQLAADVHADELLAERLLDVESVAAYASEERSRVEESEAYREHGEGRYHVAVDPLDGSSNLRSNNVVGTLLGVYREPLPAVGRDLVASAYVLYGPTTTMVVATQGSVTEYVLEPDGRRAVRTDLTLPEEPTVYGFGGGVEAWTPGFERYAREVERELKLRYGGAMVGDVNQVLHYGGVFAYPALRSRPEGKLRLQFEANPIAHIVETAGGRSSDGSGSLLDVEPGRVHGRTPVHIGDAGLIDRLEDALADRR
jgi:fructose-1,6-bisphosphatase I